MVTYDQIILTIMAFTALAATTGLPWLITALVTRKGGRGKH